MQWLYKEAELLDRDHLPEWTEMLSPDLFYMIPIRETLHRGDGPGISESAGHMEETYGSIKLRVKRLIRPDAYAENPRSRTRRMVTNHRVALVGDDIAVDSCLLLIRSRGDSIHMDFISCERKDILTRSPEGALLLKRRMAILDQSVVNTSNFGVFL